MPSLSLVLAIACVFLPMALLLALYDLRWIVLSLRAGRRPPWGAPLRVLAALFCHGGVALLVAHHADWPEPMLTYWLHMTLDPGLTFYAIGLYDLFLRVQRRA